MATHFSSTRVALVKLKLALLWRILSLTIILEAKHCPPSSDVRALISKPLPRCQTKTILDFFEDDVQVDADQCTCCFACMKRHSESGCEKCCEFLAKFVTHKSQGRVQNLVWFATSTSTPTSTSTKLELGTTSASACF